MANAPGTNSFHVRNSAFSPAKLVTLEKQGTPPVEIAFNVVTRDHSLVDTTIANYEIYGLNSSLNRWLLNSVSKAAPNFFKGELTTKFNNVSPKQLSFEIILRSNIAKPGISHGDDLHPQEIVETIQKLQALCYPRLVFFGNPPLCRLMILNLYNLYCYVERVEVVWMNLWDLDRGIPVGADIQMQVLMQQYPTFKEVLGGASFKSLDTHGYTGRPQTGTDSGTPFTGTSTGSGGGLSINP